MTQRPWRLWRRRASPAAEAATETELTDRLRHYGSHFWLMWDGEKLAGFVDGMVTNQADLTDELYAQAALHDESGAWQMIFGVNTLPGLPAAGHCGDAAAPRHCGRPAQGRRGLVLTCKEHLLHYYAKLGFVNEGVSGSVHGGAVWYQMRLTFENG